MCKLNKGKSGISLVALIITIIVLIILTGAVIMTMNKGDTIGKSKEAVFKSDMTNYREELSRNILNEQVKGNVASMKDVTVMPGDVNYATEIKKYIPNITSDYMGKLGIKEGNLYYESTNNTEYKKWLAELNISTMWNNEFEDDLAITNGKCNGFNSTIDTRADKLSNATELILPDEYKNISIPEGVTEIIDSAFLHCTNLESVEIPNTVKSMGASAFCDCSSLNSVTLPDSITSIGPGSFCRCAALNNITLPKSILSVEMYTFNGCTSLSSIVIPNNVTSIGMQSFSGCSSLANITFSKNLIQIGDYAFYGCTSLTSITLPKSVTQIGDDTFASCTNLTQIRLENGSTLNTANASNWGIDTTKVTITVL